MHTENCSSMRLDTSEISSVQSTVNNVSILEEDLALSSSTLGIEKKCEDSFDEPDYVPFKPLANKLVYLNEETMDCSYSEPAGTPKNPHTSTDEPSSPDLFNSTDEEFSPKPEKSSFTRILSKSSPISPRKPTQSELILKSDEYLLKRISKLLTGVPPPPSHTICQADCTDFLTRLKQNRDYFWANPFTNNDQPEKSEPMINVDKINKIEPVENPIEKPVKPLQNPRNELRTYPPRRQNGLRNLSTAFDACEASSSSISTTTSTTTDILDSSVLSTTESSRDLSKIFPETETTTSTTVKATPAKRVTFDVPAEENLAIFRTMSEDEAQKLSWPEAAQHKSLGIIYNRNRFIEDFEHLTVKLCQRYVGNDTQSTCTSWFTKQTPGSVKKRSLLARRSIGQSPGKRLSHLARRRRTFSSANLQGLGEKRQLTLNMKRPSFKKGGKSPRGKSPRGKSPRGKSPRGKSPRNSAKKRMQRRLSIEGPSPRKTKLETSKRALFQSPPHDRAGPSIVSQSSQSSNPQRIKRALFPTPKKKEGEERKGGEKRKSDEELEGHRSKWAKSLSFECSHSVENSRDASCDSRKGEGSSSQRQEISDLSEINRRKLLFAVSDALKSKGINAAHPKFKQYVSQLARIVKKFMPDLDNKNIPKKPGSTTDRMLKLAKTYAPLVLETPSTS